MSNKLLELEIRRFLSDYMKTEISTERDFISAEKETLKRQIESDSIESLQAAWSVFDALETSCSAIDRLKEIKPWLKLINQRIETLRNEKNEKNWAEAMGAQEKLLAAEKARNDEILAKFELLQQQFEIIQSLNQENQTARISPYPLENLSDSLDRPESKISIQKTDSDSCLIPTNASSYHHKSQEELRKNQAQGIPNYSGTESFTELNDFIDRIERYFQLQPCWDEIAQTLFLLGKLTGTARYQFKSWESEYADIQPFTWTLWKKLIVTDPRFFHIMTVTRDKMRSVKQYHHKWTVDQLWDQLTEWNSLIPRHQMKDVDFANYFLEALDSNYRDEVKDEYRGFLCLIKKDFDLANLRRIAIEKETRFKSRSTSRSRTYNSINHLTPSVSATNTPILRCGFPPCRQTGHSTRNCSHPEFDLAIHLAHVQSARQRHRQVSSTNSLSNPTSLLGGTSKLDERISGLDLSNKCSLSLERHVSFSPCGFDNSDIRAPITKANRSQQSQGELLAMKLDLAAHSQATPPECNQSLQCKEFTLDTDHNEKIPTWTVNGEEKLFDG